MGPLPCLQDAQQHRKRAQDRSDEVVAGGAQLDAIGGLRHSRVPFMARPGLTEAHLGRPARRVPVWLGGYAVILRPRRSATETGLTGIDPQNGAV